MSSDVIAKATRNFQQRRQQEKEALLQKEEQAQCDAAAARLVAIKQTVDKLSLDRPDCKALAFELVARLPATVTAAAALGLFYLRAADLRAARLLDLAALAGFVYADPAERERRLTPVRSDALAARLAEIESRAAYPVEAQKQAEIELTYLYRDGFYSAHDFAEADLLGRHARGSGICWSCRHYVADQPNGSARCAATPHLPRLDYRASWDTCGAWANRLYAALNAMPNPYDDADGAPGAGSAPSLDDAEPAPGPT